MNLTDPHAIAMAVALLDDMKGDDEAAHGFEDEIHQGVLANIALGVCADPRACAAEAIKTTTIKFHRWCA